MKKLILIVCTLFIQSLFAQTHTTGPDTIKINPNENRATPISICEAISKGVQFKQLKFLKKKKQKITFENYLDREIVKSRVEIMKTVAGPLIDYSHCDCDKKTIKELMDILRDLQDIKNNCQESLYSEPISLIPKLSEILRYYESRK